MLNSITALLGNGAVAALGDYESIATVTLSGTSSTIDFTSIPSTYKHLQIRGIARTNEPNTGAADLSFRINSDSGSNYAWHRLTGDGTSAAASGYASQTYASTVLGVIPLANNTANTFGTFVIDILDYANTSKYKTLRMLAGTDDNSGSASRSRLTFTSNLWMSTSAISSLSFYPSSNSFVQYSQIALYGING